MSYSLIELRNKEVFNQFKEELNEKDEFKKFRNLYNVDDFEKRFDREDKSREVNRVNQLDDKEIYEKAKGNTKVESYIEVEIGYCKFVRIYGEEYLESYCEDDELYTSSFLGLNVEII